MDMYMQSSKLSTVTKKTVFKFRIMEITSIQLAELNAPRKLSDWFRVLPQHKEHSDDCNDEDVSFCTDLAKYSYQNQLVGSQLARDFTETDFENMVLSMHSVIRTETESVKRYNHQWIWKCIQRAQRTDCNDHHSGDDGLQWINNLWTKFRVFSDPNNEYIVEDDEKYEQNEEHKQNEGDLDADDGNQRVNVRDDHEESRSLKKPRGSTTTKHRSSKSHPSPKSPKPQKSPKAAHRESQTNPVHDTGSADNGNRMENGNDRYSNRDVEGGYDNPATGSPDMEFEEFSCYTLYGWLAGLCMMQPTAPDDIYGDDDDDDDLNDLNDRDNA